MPYPTGNPTFDQAAYVAAAAQQAAVQAATTQAAAHTADLAYFNTVAAAASSAGLQVPNVLSALDAGAT